MAECSEDERELLDHILSTPSLRPRVVEFEALVGRVLIPKLDPALRERAINITKAFIQAREEHAAIWDELQRLGFQGHRRGPLETELEHEAHWRLGKEPS